MADGRPIGLPPAWWFSASTYAAIGLFGLLLLAVALYRNSLPGVPDADYLRIGLAVAGGSLSMLGLGRWSVLRRYPGGGRRRPEPKQPPSAEGRVPYQSYNAPPDARAPRRKVAPPFDSVSRGPYRSRRAGAPLVAGVAALVLVSILVAGLSFPPAPGASAGPSAAHSLPAALHAPEGSPPARAVSAAINCVPGIYPVYGPVDGFNPPLPKYADQSPCKISHDEVHASFSSPVPGSGQDVLFPIHLPASGSYLPDEVYSDIYLGMVVKGDSASVDGQSYASVEMTPGVATNGSTDWNVAVVVWSLLLNNSCGSGLNFTWKGGYGCVVLDLKNGPHTLLSSVPGGSNANVTFMGSATQSTEPLRVYFNDTTDSNLSAAWTLTAAATGTYAFQPYYATACPDACLLNWTMPFGLGEGVDLCDNGLCTSYNATLQLGAPPFEIGSPEYWNGLAYAGDYRYVALESSTGACGAVGGVPPCTPDGQAGDYPTLTFNGTTLDFAGNYSYATETFGGATHEFNAFATETDFEPLFLDELANSSRVGYVAPGSPLNVSVRAQGLGTVRWVNLSYVLPGGLPTNESMHLVSGVASNGYYNATVPGTGPDGTISYRASATDEAGAIVMLPASGDPAATVNRTKIPTVTVGEYVVPGSCGGISINGSAFAANGSSDRTLAGAYAIDASGCYPYAFTGWTTTGGVSVVGSGASARVIARSNGTVTAHFGFYHPLDSISLAFSPTTCGEIGLNGSVYPATGSAQGVSLRDDANYSLSVAACGGDSFAGWIASNPANLTIVGPVLSLHGNGTITATFVPTATSYPIVFYTTPSACGGVRLGSAGYSTGEAVNLLAGSGYSIGPDPCYGWGFAGNVSTSGSVSVSGGDLTVSGAGTVSYSYYKLTLVSVLTSPSGCGGVEWDGVFESGGAVLNVTNHTVHNLTGSPCAGYYLGSLVTSGGVSLTGSIATVNGPGSILAVFRPGVQQYYVGFETNPSTCGAIEFDGTPFSNSQYVDVLPDTIHTIHAVPCAGYGLVNWSKSGSIGVPLGPVASGLAYVNGSGSILATFHPLVTVSIATSPTDCGSVTIAPLHDPADAVAYPNGSVATLPEYALYVITPDPCAHDHLSSWEATGGASIANGTLDLTGAAIIAAIFVPTLYPVSVAIAPAACGLLTIGSIPYSNGSWLNLTAGAYPYATTVCAGFELTALTASGGVNLSGTSLIVTGPGAVNLTLGAIPPALALYAPSSSVAGLVASFRASVAVPVPPYNYTYDWTFGDGTSLATPSNFTSHTYGTPGTYEVSVTVHDPFGRSASAFANVTIVSSAGASGAAIGATGYAVIGLAVVVVAAALVYAAVNARRGRRAEPPTSDDSEAPPAPEGP